MLSKCWVECWAQKNICHVLFYFHTRKEYKVIFKHLILWFSLEGSWGVKGGNGYSHEQSGTDCDFKRRGEGQQMFCTSA